MFQGFPAVVCLMGSMTTNMYNAIWHKLFEIVPDLQTRIETIICDFERAQIASARITFPQGRVGGCIFHYKQVSFPMCLT